MYTWDNVNAIYQIYPRSFKDSNSDGIGDLKGIIEKLDYIKSLNSQENSLNVDAIWLSPFFLSPQKDCGYDISNYLQIDPIFGNLNDFKTLLDEAHKRDIKILLDLVPNHTSDKHPWFIESRKSKDNPYRDYYVWKDQKNGKYPNNWLSMSGGSMWQWDENTKQYYLHSFLKSQPDLNWNNPKVREEIQNIMRYWLDLSVDGFRVDAVWALSKDPDFKDNPINEATFSSPQDFGSFINKNSKNGPNLKKYLKSLTDVLNEYQDRFMVFEFYPDSLLGDTYMQYQEIQDISNKSSVFYFELFELTWWARKYQERLNLIFSKNYDNLPVVSLGNHDQPRIASRYGYGEAKALALIQMTLPGIPQIYYGEELGMTDVDIKETEAYDNFGGNGFDLRDKVRTPFRWNNSNYGDFSSVKPWLPMGNNLETINVESELKNQESFLSFYKKLLSIRKKEATLRNGKYELLNNINDEILSFKRTSKDKEFYILVNFTDRNLKAPMPSPGKILVSTNPIDNLYVNNEISLRAFEGVLIEKVN